MQNEELPRGEGPAVSGNEQWGEQYLDTVPDFNPGVRQNESLERDDSKAETETAENKDDSATERENSPEKLHEDFSETKELVSEIDRVDYLMRANYLDLKTLLINFGFDFLSKRYGAKKVSEELRAELGKLNGDNNRPRAIEAAVSDIYERVEPSVETRLQLFEEMRNDETSVGRDSTNGRLVDGTITMDRSGRVIVYKSGIHKDFNHQLFIGGLHAFVGLMGAVENPDSKIFVDGKRTVAEMTEGIENPSLMDYINKVYGCVAERAGDAHTSLTNIETITEAAADRIKESLEKSLEIRNKPLHDAQEALMDEELKLHDTEGSKILMEAAGKLFELQQERSEETRGEIMRERQKLYDGVGQGSELYIDNTAPRMQKRSEQKSWL